MKNLRKLLAVVVVVAMMATFMIPAFAEESTLSDAEICETLGILKGTGDGVTEEYLASATERNQAAIMFLRLQNLEDEALAYDGEDNFDDADELWSGGQAVLAYLKANPDLGWQGVGDNKFEPRANIDAKSYYKVMLEALGYKQDVDFEWGEVLEFAAEKGLSAIADVEELTNADIATATVEALKATVKDSEQTLIEKLIADGVVSEDAAIEAELISGELAIAEFKAAGAKKLSVRFNRAVEDTSKMVFAVKRDNVTVNIAKVEWNEAKTEATLNASYKLQDGDYTVSAKYDGGDALTATAVGVKEAKVSKITFTRDIGVITDSAADPAADDKKALNAYVKFENQYGEDLTNDIGAGELSVSASKGSKAAYDDGVLRLEDVSVYEVDKTVVVTIVHDTTATVASKTLTVAQGANIASIEIGDLATDDEDLKDDPINVANLGTDYDKYYIPLTVVDQYGNTLKKADLADLIITSSNPRILKVNNAANLKEIGDDKVPAIAILAADATATSGTVVVTVVSTSGKSASKTIEVLENSVIDVMTLQQPSTPLKETKETEIPFTAVNQYGNALVSKDDLVTLDTSFGSDVVFSDNTKITITGGQIKAGVDYSKDNARTIIVKPTAGSDKVVITVITAKAKVQTLTLSVEDMPVPNAITGLDKDFKLAIQQGLSQNLDESLVVVKDQYGDSIDLDTYGTDTYTIAVEANDGTADVVGIGANTTISSGGSPVVFTASNTLKGSETIKLTLKKGTTTVDEYTFTMQAVAFKDITEFGIDDIGKMYVKNGAHADYNKTFNVYGMKGTTKVVVNQTIIKDAYTTVENVAAATNGSLTIGADTTVDTEGKDKTGKLTVVVEGYSDVKTLTKDIVYSTAAPEATKFVIRDPGTEKEITDTAKTYAATDLDGKTINAKSATAPFQFYVEDQYGIALDGSTYIITNVSTASGNISQTGGTLTVTGVASGDYFTITAITPNGMSKSIKIFIE